MIIKNFWFIVLAFIVIDFIWVRKLSSYGSKWMMVLFGIKKISITLYEKSIKMSFSIKLYILYDIYLNS